MGEWMYRSTFSWPRHKLEVSGQLHAPAALPPGKQPPVSIGYEAEWAPEPVWTTWRKEISLPYRDSNSDPSVVQLEVSRYTDYAIPTPCNCLHTYVLSIYSSPNIGRIIRLRMMRGGDERCGSKKFLIRKREGRKQTEFPSLNGRIALKEVCKAANWTYLAQNRDCSLPIHLWFI
jgi:hypothetical protein